MRRMPKRTVREGIVLAVLSLVVVACGRSGSNSTAASSNSSSTAASSSSAFSSGTAVSLKGSCPDKIVLQTDWFPESDHGYSYQLIGPNGTTSKDKGTYTGPLLDPTTGKTTGVDLEIRAGGPAIGFQPPVAQMYSDDNIFMAYADTADQIRNSKKLPTVAVMAPLNKSPQVLMFDPVQHPFKTLGDVGKSGAKVLYFDGSVFMDYLVAKGDIKKAQLDGSYDGSFTKFVADGGSDVMQGYATREPYELEHNTPGWNKPVSYLFVDDAGYKIYQSALVVRPETTTKFKDCLTKLVPLFQKGMLKFLADPQPMNDAFIKIVDTLATFWKVSAGGNQFTVDQSKKFNIVANSPDGSYGTFDSARVQSVIDAVLPIFKGRNLDSYNPDVKPSDIVTNAFVDKSIRLR